MKYIFFGTPDFSAHLLKTLLEKGMVPVAVVCNPDRPIGRKKIITPPPVKTVAEIWNAKPGTSGISGTNPANTNITIFQPEKLDAEFREKLRALDADLFVVFAYNKIFHKDILAIPRHGVVGVHPSWLPTYRGPSPFQTAILDGATETGVTLYLLDEGIDSGPIIARSESVPITDQDTFKTLAVKLSDAGANLLIKTLPDIMAGKISPVAQNESHASYTKKFTTQDGFIEPDEIAKAGQGDDGSGDAESEVGSAKNTANGKRKAHQILRKINSLNPEPGVWTIQNGKRVKLLKAQIVHGGTLKLIETQKEGEKPKRC